MVRFRHFFILGVLCCLVSCSKIQYLDQALALKGYSDERDAQAVDVVRRDALFEQLLLRVRSGEIQTSVRTAVELERQFGAPVLKQVLRTPPGAFEWLYRYQVNYSGAKVYVTVLPDGKVQGFRYVPAAQ